MKTKPTVYRVHFAVLATLILTFSIAGPAHADVWDRSFLFETGFENPLVRVGFNPQPEPPIAHDTNLLLGDPSNPGIEVLGIDPTPFRVVFALGQMGESFFVGDVAEPDMTGNTMFTIFMPAAIPLPAFNVVMNFQTSSGGIVTPGSWVSFNPQPEPPMGMPMGSTQFGFDFEFTSFSTVSMHFQITDVATGEMLEFSHIPDAVIPEPASMTLLGLGLAGFALRRRKMKA